MVSSRIVCVLSLVAILAPTSSSQDVVHSRPRTPPPGLGAVSHSERMVFSDVYRRTALADASSGQVVFVTHESPDVATSFTRWYAQQSVAFQLQALAGRGAEELFVTGYVARTDETVIEKWTLLSRQGVWVAPIAAAPSGSIGTPSTSSGVPALSVPGGSYVPVAQRTPAQRALTVQRSEVYRGPSLGANLDVVVDPEGRFLIVSARATAKFWQISLDLVPVVTELTGQVPGYLAGDVLPGAVYEDSSTAGRAFVFGHPVGVGPLRFVAFRDYDNDGVVDFTSAFTDAEYSAGGYPGNWVDNFVNIGPPIPGF